MCDVFVYERKYINQENGRVIVSFELSSHDWLKVENFSRRASEDPALILSETKNLFGRACGKDVLVLLLRARKGNKTFPAEDCRRE